MSSCFCECCYSSSANCGIKYGPFSVNHATECTDKMCNTLYNITVSCGSKEGRYFRAGISKNQSTFSMPPEPTPFPPALLIAIIAGSIVFIVFVGICIVSGKRRKSRRLPTAVSGPSACNYAGTEGNAQVVYSVTDQEPAHEMEALPRYSSIFPAATSRT